MYKELNDLHKLQPLWATITITVATLATNWIWGSWFSQAKGMAAFLLMFGCLIGWPLMLVLFNVILGFGIKLGEGQALLRMAILLGVVGVGFAVYGIPSPWNLLGCAIVALAVGFQAGRAAQDDADLEDL